MSTIFPKDKMRLIVTGGSGFIGSNFIRHILQKYHSYEIVNVDKLTYAGNKDNLKDLEVKENYSLIRADICDMEAMRDIIKEGDVIVNFAAESHVDNSIKDPREFIRTNVMGTHNLLEIARSKGARLFVQVSTDEVYGSLGFDDKPSDEEARLNPSSPYSASKAAAEMLCLANIRTYKQPIIITRSSNNFGPYQFPEKIIPLFITNLIEGKNVPLYGEGENIRDWIYVKDNCEAIDFIIHKGKAGEIYNIGGENEIQNVALTGMILKMMGAEDSKIEHVKDRPGHDLRYSLECEKIKTLGWKPEKKFDSALRETVNWYKNNEMWWKPLKEKMK